MRLLELYSLSTGLKIGKQWLLERFFPLPFSRYMLLHASSGMLGKNYPYYSLVVDAIKPYLDKADIKIVQMGGKDDPAIPGCYHIMGKDNLHQASYLVRNAMLHLGNDSVWGHRAGHLGIPLVQPWGTTSPDNHSSLEHDPGKTRFLVSHRWGRNPTFAAQENPQTIALVDPYDMARAVLELLGIKNEITQKTLHMGAQFNNAMLEWLPNAVVAPQFNPDLPLAVRYDLVANEGILTQTLQTGRKVNIVTKSAINPQLLAAFKGSIITYNHEIDESTQIDYVKQVRQIIPGAVFFTRETDAAKVAALRFRFFDVTVVQQAIDKTRQDLVNATREYLNDSQFDLDIPPKLGRLEFRSNKYVLSNGKIYLSLAHEKRDWPIGSPEGNVPIDEDIWFHDQSHWLIYTT